MPGLARTSLALLLALAFSALAATPARAWWNGDWPDRMKITADAGPKGANITGPIGRTRVLIRLHSGNFNFATARDDGADLRLVAADDRTPLHFQIESYDGLINQVALIWVDIPDLAPGAATAFYLYWGNKNATPASDGHATFDADEVLAYEFAEENGVPHDSTGYGNNALTAGRRDDGGMIGLGLKLDGTAPVRLPASPSLALAEKQPWTWSLWVHPADPARPQVLYSLRDGSNLLSIGLQGGMPYVQIDTGAGTQRAAATAPLAGDSWHHVAVLAGDRIALYVDGQKQAEVAATLPAMSASAMLGGLMPAPPPPPTPGSTASPPAADTAAPPTPDATNFAGLIDELEIARVERPAGALQVAVHNQGPQANLLTFDVAEESSLFGTGYVGIIVRSVTPDAWVVIGILGVMMLISWTVMVTKALYLNGVTGANRVFLAQLHDTRARGLERGEAFPSIPADRHRALRHSTLFRLYEVGTRELAERERAGRIDAQGMLAPQSLAAIRSTIDGTMVRENIRLNRLMVLLTIAISGGPFLGLLGTVVGVMITFAAIAAAGDVNVNAIAPGIAAALLATVAGLAVAIPALFGYNYFVTRIRDATADMQVFADELVTRMGEGTRPAGTALSRAAE
jgi:biopolymer transport protein ExbB